MHRINNKGKIKNRSKTIYPERDVVQIFYDRELETLKAIRKLMIYSYASTRNKAKPKLKELLEFIHQKDNIFRVKVISKQETDFDEMFYFFRRIKIYLHFTRIKISLKRKTNYLLIILISGCQKKELKKYASRTNVIYILNNKDE